jgi:DNA-binding transcriptional LysR family regulator
MGTQVGAVTPAAIDMQTIDRREARNHGEREERGASPRDLRAAQYLTNEKFWPLILIQSILMADGRSRPMDTELARTFLTVVAAGNFIHAADRLHVTQSTVSARIRTLEDQLRCRLFVRNKAGTTLTPAGRQFQKHASTLVRTAELARRDVGVPSGFRASITIGARIGLWEGLLVDWLPLMRAAAPDVSVHAEIGFETEIMQGLVEGRIDIGVMYTPQNRPGLKVEPLLVERLLLVTTDPDGGRDLDHRYVLVDWGPEFHAKHSAAFPNFVGPGITANIGWLGMQHVLRNGGSGYFPERLVRPMLKRGRLRPVPGAPEFTLPAYVVVLAEGDADLMAIAVSGLRKIADATTRKRRLV